MSSFSIVSLNISKKTGEPKKPVNAITVKSDFGIENDAHAGPGHRQVSLLALEDIRIMQQKLRTIKPGDFAENITTQGIDLPALPLGSKLTIGEVVLEVTQIGKTCHKGCSILEQTGDCIMPRRGIFTKVISGGEISHESTGTYHI